jgi:hypothetical protein
MNDTDNIKILSNHFEKVYNRDSTYDPQVLKKLRKTKVIQYFAQPSTRDKLREAIQKMNLLAAPGESGLSPITIQTNCFPYSRGAGMEQTPTWSRTDQSSTDGSTMKKGKTAIQTIVEASAYKLWLQDIYYLSSARDSSKCSKRRN